MTQIFAGQECGNYTFLIRQQLTRLGLSSSREPYHTLFLMVEAALRTGHAAPQMKALHAYAAAHSGKTLSAVTRAASRAMEELWEHGDREALADLFGKPLVIRPHPRDLVLRLRERIIALEREDM